MNYWLFKSEPSVYSIDDLRRDKITPWDGVRNYQARNLLRDAMRVGDRGFFYHSNAQPPAIVGEVKIVRAGYPDPTAFEKGHRYFDTKSRPDKPAWYAVDVAFAEKYGRTLSLAFLREVPGLEEMVLLRKGSRLSVQPVSAQEFRIVRRLARGA